MKPGDYVRYKDFNDIDVIARVIKIKNTKPDDDITYYLDNDDFICYDKDSDTFLDDVICSAKSIIELLYPGDYVNGYKVHSINTYGENPIHYFVNIKTPGNVYTTIYESDIKSVVTKEQFESISYKVGR